MSEAKDLLNGRQFWTVRALAEYWCVSTRTVWRDIRKGAVRVYRLPGGAVRIKAEDAILYGKPCD